jgi:hypothetical protein
LAARPGQGPRIHHGALLAAILQASPDAHGVLSCRRAMPADARLLIVELVLPDGPEPSLAKFADLEMLAVTPNGRQRTTAQYRALLERAGLTLTEAVPALAANPASYIEALPARR